MVILNGVYLVKPAVEKFVRGKTSNRVCALRYAETRKRCGEMHAKLLPANGNRQPATGVFRTDCNPDLSVFLAR